MRIAENDKNSIPVVPLFAAAVSEHAILYENLLITLR